MFTKQDFADTVIQMWEKCRQHESVTEDVSERMAMRKALLDNFAQIFTYKMNTLTHMWALTKMRGECWQLLKKVLLGQTEPAHGVQKNKGNAKRAKTEGPGGERVQSMNSLQKWTSLPDVCRVSMLRAVVNGSIPLSGLAKASKMQLGRLRARDKIIEHVESTEYLDVEEFEEQTQFDIEEGQPLGWTELLDVWPEVEVRLVQTWAQKWGDISASKVPVGWQEDMLRAFAEKKEADEVNDNHYVGWSLLTCAFY